jgi:DMSO/TMAO reductase YedYZ heme-binding membrane subunit
MTEQEFCQDCNQKHDCQKIYEQLGNLKGPSVVFKVIVAFLLPVLVFIVSLAVFEEIFAKTINTEQLQTLLSFLIALLITFACILIVQAINRRLR